MVVPWKGEQVVFVIKWLDLQYLKDVERWTSDSNFPFAKVLHEIFGFYVLYGSLGLPSGPQVVTSIEPRSSGEIIPQKLPIN